MKKYLLAALFLVSANANAALITNGGFEDVGIAPWSCSGGGLCSAQSGTVHSGSQALRAYSNFTASMIHQTFATTAGVTYDLEFWSKASNIHAGNILSYAIDGTSATTVTTTTDWLLTQLSFVATSSVATLGFFYETDIGSGSWFIDDVAEASAVSAVPVPAALFMFAPALLGFLGLRRKARA